jgi:hypothetical protein
LQKTGVDTRYSILYGDERMGDLLSRKWFAMQRASRIVYDRFDSAFAHIKKGDVNWNDILRKMRPGFTTLVSLRLFLRVLRMLAWKPFRPRIN